ncbi:LysR substrate-binding domain-containing protein [Paraburkholderia phenazinium]|uniref:LysR substrate-binding domain-containing protein n=1 Tax=Paraburkholderia phenazinium TaxID=60549 RepID=UPI00158D8EBF|nr:LysR substrate-binding domain-containing protein [Paraburkholderia phenazinium]
MRKLPSLQALRAFEAAARLQSFLLAAEELHLTPSAISHQVRGLEAYFEHKLFKRSNRRVELTDSGGRLLATLSTAFDMIEEVCRDLSPKAAAESLSVHCTPSFASKWLGPRLPAFMREYPSLTIRMSSSAEPVDLLKEEGLDVAIAYGSVRAQAGVVIEALGAERTAPLASPKLVGERFEREDIAKLTLIESKLNPLRWREWFKQNGLKMPDKPQPSFDRAALVLAAAVDGLGVALESVRFAERELASGELVIVGEGLYSPIERETHFFCYRAADRSSRKIQQFHDWLLRESRALSRDD